MKKITLLFIFSLNMYFTMAADYYWANGSGNWSDFAAHWATSSGGTAFHSTTPGPNDNVFFDAASFTAGNTVTITQTNVFCKNFTWLNTAFGSDLVTTDTSYKISIFGSIVIDVNSDISFDGAMSFESPVMGNSITIMDTISCKLRFNSPGSDWTLVSALNTKNEIKLINGTLNLNSMPFSCSSFISDFGTAGRTLIPGNTELRIVNYDYDGSFPVTTHFWKVDNQLGLNSTNNDLVFEAIPPQDTSNLAWGGVAFSLVSGNQNYRNVIVKAPGFIPTGNDSFLIIANFDATLNSSSIQSIKLDNGTYTYLSCGNIHVDSIITRGITGIGSMDLGITFWDTASVNYIEAGSITMTTGIYIQIEKVVSLGNLVINSYNLPTPIVNVTSFGDVFAGGDFSESNATLQDLNPSTFRKCVIGGDGHFYSDTCIFDTLMFSSGHEYIIESGKTIFTNNQFIAFGSPGNEIQIHSGTTGVQANMEFNQNNVCSDYLYLRDINASGNNIIAGANSQDIANNSGWQFISCTVISDVWPGDANYDLIVNNFDLLNIGIAYGEAGSPRAGGSNNYVAQPATDWGSFFQSAINKKHADCDGNGNVNDDDTLAIFLNYGLNHPARLGEFTEALSSGYELAFQLPSGPVIPGTILNIPISLGTSAVPVDSVYGIAFSVNYDPSFVVQGSVYMDYSSSWVAAPGNFIHIEKDFYTSGKLDMAFSRIDHNNDQGFGTIGNLIFTLSNNAGGLLNLSFSNIRIITFSEMQIPVTAINGSVVTEIETIESNDIVSVFYPNPMHAKAKLAFSNPTGKEFNLVITDIAGKNVLADQYTSDDEITIEWENPVKGIYLYELKSKDMSEVSRGKFLVE